MRLLGPVFHKELLELSRRRSTYYLRVIAGAGLLAVILLYGLSPGQIDAGLSTTKRQAAIGAIVFENWMLVQFWIVCGAMPLLVCNLVAAEREAGSLELLFTTHLTNREIVLGKLASRVFVVVLLVFSAAPVLVILSLLGGVDFDRLLKILFLTLTSALMIAAAGAYYSTVAKRPWVACLQTYGLFVMLWAFAPFAIIALYQFYIQTQTGGMPGMPPRWLFFTLMTLAPWFDVFFLCDTKGRALAGWLLDWDGVLMFGGIWAGIAAVFLIFSMRELRVGPRKSLVGRIAALLARPFVYLARLAFGKRGEAMAARPWRPRLPNYGFFESNPIVWRNRRADVYDPDGHMFRLQLGAWILAAGMIGLFYASYGSGGHGRMPVYAVLWLEIAFLHVMIATVGAASISRERQRGSLDLLLLSGLSTFAIVTGTIRGVVRACSPTIFLVAVTIYAAVLFETFALDFALAYGAIVFAYTAALIVASIFISSAASLASHAVFATIFVGLAFWFMPLPVGTLFAILDRRLNAQIDGWLTIIVLLAYGVVVSAMFVVGMLSLRGQRAILGVGAVSFSVPALCLQLAPTAQRADDASLLWRWLSDFDNSYYRRSISQWRSSNHIADWTPWIYLLAALLLFGIAIWKFDVIVGRAFRRGRQLAAKPPLIGRNISDAGSNSPIPMSAPL